MDNLNRATTEYGMKISAGKTKVMGISSKGRTKVSIDIDGQQIEQVREFRYLSSLISDDGYCEKKLRVELGWQRMYFRPKGSYLQGK